MTGSGPRRKHYETRQRQAVLDALARAPGFLSARALHDQLRLDGRPVALSTVYRALHAYAEAGRIGITRTAVGEHLFRLAPIAGRSHYLVCRACGASVPLDAHIPGDWAVAVAAEHGFADIHVVIELAGLCPTCGNEPKDSIRRKSLCTDVRASVPEVEREDLRSRANRRYHP
ncbi:transcriptional repressor [Amycolatopsis sp. NBC_01488]|uniref:Fur family transcriptional regulator n=1 Tax=Amycolatopsis sp. NBC_01488 TaxID=2903563 RepID=UPI002E2B3EFE|nr:Fur family transcriptional regulator [Amycolatopsis sp. NBC_01488]